MFTNQTALTTPIYWQNSKKDITRTIEHQEDSFKGKWESLGVTEHCLEFHRQFNWINPKTCFNQVAVSQTKSKSLQKLKKQQQTKNEKF